MPELVVVPAALVAAARSMEVAANRLDAVNAALPGMTGDVGPGDLVHALEDAAHVWQHALRGLSLALAGAGERLVSAASGYDGLEEMLTSWAAP